MARKRKRKHTRGSPPPTLGPPEPTRSESVPTTLPPPGPEPPERASQVGDYEDRVAFAQAFSDVSPLRPRRARSRPVQSAPGEPPVSRRAERIVPLDQQDEARARARLDALVAEAVRFRIDREEGYIEGIREGVPTSVSRALRKKGVIPEARLDLHGQTGEEAEQSVGRFVRAEHRKGVRRLLIVHGKGLHSEGGMGILGDRVAHALTSGRAAPLVTAFVTAPVELGGSGALLVQLTSK